MTIYVYLYSLICIIIISVIQPHACQESAVDESCVEGSTWIEGCKNCTCIDAKRICSSSDCNIVAEVSDTFEKSCEFTIEGARWRKGCNWCHCHRTDGFSMCTRRGCHPELEIHLRESKQCDKDAKWKKDLCNWCQCVDNIAKCTNNTCERTSAAAVQRARAARRRNRQKSLSSSAEECKVTTKGSRWKRSCNWCRCSSTLLRGFCTRKLCNKNHNNSGKDKNECEGDASWKKENCNWCNCVNGTGLCTEIFCSVGRQLSVAKKEKEITCNEPDASNPGRWRVKCNWCHCRDGISVCSKRGCLPADMTRDTEICEGTVRWKKECNWCGCHDGLATCTEKLCVHEGPGGSTDNVTSTTEASVKEDTCIDGTSWVENCNTCYCIAKRTLCTVRPCNTTSETSFLAERSNSDFQMLVDENMKQKFQTCKIGSRWRVNCNWCTCTTTNAAICTLVGCLPGFNTVNAKDPQCEDGSEWMDSCNFCTCEKGIAICTVKECSQVEILNPRSTATQTSSKNTNVQEKHDISCTEGSRWMKNCNWCSCTGGVAVCTLIACIDNTDNFEDTCMGNSKWKKKCNWCHCSNDKGICAERICQQPIKESTVNDISTIKPSSDTPVKVNDCISGNSWTDICNTCICINNIKVCTKKFCDVSHKEPCKDTENWESDCNTCQCIKGETTCTRNRCRKAKVLPELCHLAAIEHGNNVCEGFFQKWTFVAANGICKEIVYGGCGGTQNLFDTEEECYNTCGNQEQMSQRQVLISKERCLLPTEQGKCFAFMTRFSFAPENNRCEQFIYGGCQGNENNFRTAQDCYLTCGGEPPVIDPNCDRSKCDWKRHAHYFVKKCKPVYQGGSCCPIKFDCSKSALPKSNVKCFYNDNEYNAGDRVPVDHSCSNGCFCRQGFGNKPAEINCASVECPSLFREPDDNCRQIYSEDSCCSISEECHQNSPALGNERSFNCESHGQTFHLGDRMYFEEFPCQQCVCTPGFNGPKGPGCKKVNCGFEFRYREKIVRGCTPLYFEDQCCPIDWLCPGDKTLSRPPLDALPQVTSVRTALCKTGNISVPIGSIIPVTDCHLRCSCETPPDITCVRFRSCDLAELGIKPPKFEAKCSTAAQCKSDCIIEMEPSSGCPTCICSSVEFSCPEPKCPSPSTCVNGTIVFIEERGCRCCQCLCPDKPQCPMGCVVRVILDPTTGCDICECDPTDVFNN